MSNDEESNGSGGPSTRRSGRNLAGGGGAAGDSSNPASDADDSSSGYLYERPRLRQQVRSSYNSGFDPAKSEREKRKLAKKNYAAQAQGRNKGAMYDGKGVLLSNGMDLCDCMAERCEGCHFPCPKCRSNKCGSECRQNRKWQYETVELDGITDSVRMNGHLVTPINKTYPVKT